MKLDMLLHRVEQAVCDITILDCLNELTDEEKEIVTPVYDKIVQRFIRKQKKSKHKRKSGGSSESADIPRGADRRIKLRGLPDRYYIEDDARLENSLSVVPADAATYLSRLRYFAASIVIGLTDYSLTAGNAREIKEMCDILNYTAEDMETFRLSIKPKVLHSFGGHMLIPTSIILFRAIFECLCEDAGLIDQIRYESELQNAWMKRVEKLKEDNHGKHLTDEEKRNILAAILKETRPTAVREFMPAEHPYRDRFLALIDYMQSAGLLNIDLLRDMRFRVMEEMELESDPPESYTLEDDDCLDDETEGTKAGPFDDAAIEALARTRALKPYYELLVNTCVIDTKLEIIDKEVSTLEEVMDKALERLFAQLDQDIAKACHDFFRQSQSRQMPMQQMGPLLAQPAKPPLASLAISGEKGTDNVESRLLSRAVPTRPLRSALTDIDALTPQVVKDIKRKMEYRCDALETFKLNAHENKKRLLKECNREEHELYTDVEPCDLCESALLCIMEREEGLFAQSGLRTGLIFAHRIGSPEITGRTPELDDEAEWNPNVFSGDNGKLETNILSDQDWLRFHMEDGVEIDELEHTASVVSRYAEHRVKLPITIRKSHVTAFRKMGASERKARDYAIIIGTLRNVEWAENENRGFYFYPFESNAGNGAAQEDALQRQLEDAIKAKRAAEHEAQRLRHELANKDRLINDQVAKLNDQIRRRDELLDLYEQIGEERPEEPVVEETLFPFYTRLRVVLYGGFDSFRRDIEKLMPGIKMIPHASHIDVTPIRNADIVFIQINRTSHSNYWNVTDTARNSNVPFYHLNNAGPKQCAMVMVEKIRELEAAR